MLQFNLLNIIQRKKKSYKKMEYPQIERIKQEGDEFKGIIVVVRLFFTANLQVDICMDNLDLKEYISCSLHAKCLSSANCTWFVWNSSHFVFSTAVLLTEHFLTAGLLCMLTRRRFGSIVYLIALNWILDNTFYFYSGSFKT